MDNKGIIIITPLIQQQQQISSEQFEILFWKVFKNKYILRLIFYQISELTNDDNIGHHGMNRLSSTILFYKDQNELDNKIKFKNLTNLQWFVKNKQWKLLEYKIKTNQFISITNPSFKSFIKKCKDIGLIKLFYERFSRDIPILDLIELSIVMNNQVSFEYFLSINHGPIYSTTFLLAIEHCSIEIIERLYEEIKPYKERVVNEFVLKSIFKMAYNNWHRANVINFIVRNQLFSVPPSQKPSDIIQPHTPIILPSKETIPQPTTRAVNEEKMPYHYFKECDLQTRKTLLKLTFVQKRRVIYQSSNFEDSEKPDDKIPGDKDSIIQELLYRIDLLFVTYHHKYLTTPNYILNQINEIQTTVSSKDQQITQLKKILAIESGAFDLFRDYFSIVPDTSLIDMNDRFQLDRFLSYVFKVLSVPGLEFFTRNHIKIIDSQVGNFRESVSQSLNVFGKNYPKYQIEAIDKLLETNKNGIVEFIQAYYNQDLVEFNSWYILFNYLLSTEKCNWHLLEKISLVPKFNIVSNLLVSVQKEFTNKIRPLEKYQWYVDKIKLHLSQRHYKQYNQIWAEIESMEYIDFLYQNKDSFFKDILSESVFKDIWNISPKLKNGDINPNYKIPFNIKSMELALHFKSKFKYIPNKLIFKFVYIDALFSCNIDQLRILDNEINGDIYTFNNPNEHPPTFKDSIKLYNYLSNESHCSNWDSLAFTTIIRKLLLQIQNSKVDTDQEHIDQHPLPISSFNFNHVGKFKKDTIKLLVRFILQLNFQMVEFIFNNTILVWLNEDAVQQDEIFKWVMEIEFIDFYGDYSRINDPNDFKNIIGLIKFLLNNLKKGTNQRMSFNSIFNYLFKRLIICQYVSFNEILEMKNILEFDENIDLVCTSFHLFHYILIKSNLLAKYLVYIHCNTYSNATDTLPNQMVQKLFNDKAPTKLDQILTEDNFSLLSIINNDFNWLLNNLRSVYIKPNGYDIVKEDFNFMLTNCKFQICFLLLENEKTIPLIDSKIVTYLSKVQDVSLIKQAIESSVENKRNAIRLLQIGFEHSELDIVELILSNYQEYSIDTTITETHKSSWLLNSNYQVFKYIFENHLHFFSSPPDLPLQLFQYKFKIGQFETCNLFLLYFPSFSITTNMIDSAINNDCVNIIKNYVDNGTISDPILLDHIFIKLKKKLKFNNWLAKN